MGVFARVAGTPADRDLIDLYVDAGLEFIGLSDGRRDNKFGIAGACADVSKRAQALDADFRTPTGRRGGLKGCAVYQYQIRNGWPNSQ